MHMCVFTLSRFYVRWLPPVPHSAYGCLSAKFGDRRDKEGGVPKRPAQFIGAFHFRSGLASIYPARPSVSPSPSSLLSVLPFFFGLFRNDFFFNYLLVIT